MDEQLFVITGQRRLDEGSVSLLNKRYGYNLII